MAPIDTRSGEKMDLVEACLQNSGSFIPCPKISLFIDPPQNLSCEVCHDSHLQVKSTRHAISDETLAILPCGHVAGFDCLNQWLQHNKTCPFCRMDLKYELCKHAIPPRAITKENLFSLPATIPEGGKIAYQCLDCRVKSNKNVTKPLLEMLSQTFKELRADFEKETNKAVKDKKRQQLMLQKKALEDFMGENSDQAQLMSLSKQW